MSPKHDLMSEIAKELILCGKNVIWKLLLLNNCHLLIYWIYFTKPEATFILKTKLRTKTASVKPNHFKHSCRCLLSVHFWKESTKVGEIKWPLNYYVQWKFLAKHIFSFHFIVQHICPRGLSHSWLRKHCHELPKKCCMHLTSLYWKKFGPLKCGSDRNRQKLIFLWFKNICIFKKMYTLLIRKSWRPLHFLRVQNFLMYFKTR